MTVDASVRRARVEPMHAANRRRKALRLARELAPLLADLRAEQPGPGEDGPLYALAQLVGEELTRRRGRR